MLVGQEKGVCTVEIKKKPSGCTYEWTCRYRGAKMRAATQPSSGTKSPRCKSKDGKHFFVRTGN